MNFQIKLFFQISAILALTTSCSVSTYYQLYKTQSKNLKEEGAAFTSSNDDIEIKYNLWSDGGNSNFLIKNKTDKTIFINQSLSHLIINGIANAYYNGIVRGNSTTIGTNSTISSSASWGNIITGKNSAWGAAGGLSSTKNTSITNQESITYTELEIINIPPNSSKIINGIILRKEMFTDCDIEDYPTKKNIKAKTFDENTSPLHIRNFICYKVGDTENVYKTKEDIFWVSEISNYPKNAFIESKKIEYCDGETSYETEDVFIFYKPNSFYIEYSAKE